MKNTFILLLIIFSFSKSYSQDLIEKIQKLTLEKDSLQKVIKPLEDTIDNLRDNHFSSNKKLNKKIDSLLKVNSDLESKIAKLEKNKLKIAFDESQKKVDSLSITVEKNNKEINNKDSLLEAKIKNEVVNLKKEKENGKLEVLNQIYQSYNKPFDDLLKSSTLKSVERDLPIIGSNQEVNQRLLNLQKYFNAEEVLGVKFNEKEVNAALNQIESLEKTELVKKLTDKLSDYKLSNEALKSTLQKIMEIDKNFPASDDNVQKLKLKEILYEFELFFYDYDFNFSDYPYLSNIILEIMNLKRLNSDTDIRQFLDKL
jgi:hypothetical protein